MIYKNIILCIFYLVLIYGVYILGISNKGGIKWEYNSNKNIDI